MCSDIEDRDCSVHSLTQQNENLLRDIHERDSLVQGLREERGNLIGEKEALIEQINVRDHIIQDSMGQRETFSEGSLPNVIA